MNLERNDFGPGHLGQKVFDLVRSGSPCERIISGPSGESLICGKPAAGSVDFDAGGIGDIVLVCGEECFKRTKEEIMRETIDIDRPTVIGINGFGRA